MPAVGLMNNNLEWNAGRTVVHNRLLLYDFKSLPVKLAPFDALSAIICKLSPTRKNPLDDYYRPGPRGQ